ncbi:MAG: DnaJ domain-containing protein [Deltaproteobacteria bacterium]|nr:DnaJ domain-containing protein [Deltaproteobacteria bacterium]
MDPAQFKARVEQIYTDLDAYTYYELLNVQADTPFDDIRRAFHRMAMLMHPDRHRMNSDQELREKLYTVYKRITEGYRVLSDDASRCEYDGGLAQGHRRLVEQKRPHLARAEDAIKNPSAKKFFRIAESFERSGDIKNAHINYKFSLDMEGENEQLSIKVAELAAALEEKKS